MTVCPSGTNSPETADVAAVVLAAIEAHPDAFSMSDWCRLPGGVSLPPGSAPPSGATLCAAAWVAHLTGWTLVDSADLVQVSARLADGLDMQGYAYAHACKDGERREIASVADVALGLDPGHGLWVAAEDVAVERLCQIAGP